MDFNSFDDKYMNLPPVLKTKLELFLSELNILFSTEKGSVLGKRNFGNALEHYLWTTSYNGEYIESVSRQSIVDCCLMNTYFDWNLTFKIMKGVSKDVGVLDIEIKEINSGLVVANPQWVFK